MNLSPKHLEHLEKCGISAWAAQNSYLESLDHTEALKRLNPNGYRPDGSLSGLWIPYFDPRSQKIVDFGRLRLDNPGEKKYEQPPGEVKLYFPPALYADDRRKAASLLSNTKIPVFIVESEKAAISLSERICYEGLVVGVGGCQNWSQRRPGASKTRLLVHHFDWIDFYGREVYICFDSDVLTNVNVQRAEEALRWAIIKQKPEVGEVKLLTVPTGEDGTKRGLDDALAAVGEEWPGFIRKLQKQAVKSRPEPVEVVSANDFLKDTTLQTETLLGTARVSLLSRGTVMFIHSSSGVGKSYFVLQLGHNIAAGNVFLGEIPTSAPKRVLILQAEMPKPWYRDRVLRLEQALGALPSGLMFVNKRFTFATSDRYRNISVQLGPLDALVKIHRPDVVILDPLQGYYNLRESDTDQNREFMNRLTEYAETRDIALVITHHDRKGISGVTGMGEMRGSSTITDWSTTVLGLSVTVENNRNECNTCGNTTKGNKKYCSNACRQMAYRNRKAGKGPTLTLKFEKVRLANGPAPEDLELERIEGSSYFQILTPDPFDS